MPIFDFIIYPLFAKINFLKKYLQRISIGLVLTMISFLISALLEYQMQNKFNLYNSPTRISIANLSPCQFNISHSTETFQVLRSEYLASLPDSFANDLTQTLNFTERAYQINGKCILENNDEVFLNQSILISNENLPKRLIFYFDYTRLLINIMDYPYSLVP